MVCCRLKSEMSHQQLRGEGPVERAAPASEASGPEAAAARSQQKWPPLPADRKLELENGAEPQNANERRFVYKIKVLMPRQQGWSQASGSQARQQDWGSWQGWGSWQQDWSQQDWSQQDWQQRWQQRDWQQREWQQDWQQRDWQQRDLQQGRQSWSESEEVLYPLQPREPSEPPPAHLLPLQPRLPLEPPPEHLRSAAVDDAEEFPDELYERPHEDDDLYMASMKHWALMRCHKKSTYAGDADSSVYTKQ